MALESSVYVTEIEDDDSPFCGANDGDKVVLPYEKKTKAWQGFVSGIIFFNCLISTFQATFTSEYISLWIIVYLVDLISLMDMVLHFYLAFYNRNGIMVLDRRKIMKRYLKTWFILDMVALLPLDVLVLIPSFRGHLPMAQALAIFRLNRLVSIHKIFRFFCKLHFLQLLRFLQISVYRLP